MNLEINGQALTAAPSAQTIGDLLAFVDGHVAAHGEVVTAVRLDGVDETAFRAPAFTARALASVRSVTIESDTPEGLARRCLGEASLELDALAAAAKAAATRFRNEEIAEGRQALEELTRNIMGLVRLVAAVRGPLARTFDTPGADGRSIPALTAELDRLTEALVRSQQDEDWVQVADILHYELAPLLLSWQSTLAAIASV